MVIRFPKKADGSFVKNVSFMFIVYWGILVLWQNISGTEVRGTVDLVIKIGLILYFSVFYLLRAKALNRKALFVMLLSCSLMITACSEETFPLSSLIAYVYPLLILFMVYGLGDGLQINRSQLVAFCNCIIVITLYAAIYAVLFCWDQFAGAFSVQYAYGNELSSFFISNFEYGMYLAAGIICCVLCLSLIPDMTKPKRIFYIIAIVLFSANLILTFSRTTILTLVLFLLIYMLVGKGKGKKWLLATTIVLVLVLLLSSELRTFISDIVFKDNDMSNRDILFEQGLRYYRSSTFFQKIFGHGIYESRLYFDRNYEHGSVHNGYLQILLYYGVIGCLALIAFMISQVVINARMIRKDRHMGAVLLGLTLSAMLIMVTTTAIVFNSSIDAFFLTAFFVLMPKYVRNSLNAGTFYN